ncbi:hypothetical protein HDU81_001058, partial [Chytriomyces hyalinus]
MDRWQPSGDWDRGDARDVRDRPHPFDVRARGSILGPNLPQDSGSSRLMLGSNARDDLGGYNRGRDSGGSMIGPNGGPFMRNKMEKEKPPFMRRIVSPESEYRNPYMSGNINRAGNGFDRNPTLSGNSNANSGSRSLLGGMQMNNNNKPSIIGGNAGRASLYSAEMGQRGPNSYMSGNNYLKRQRSPGGLNFDGSANSNMANESIYRSPKRPTLLPGGTGMNINRYHSISGNFNNNSPSQFHQQKQAQNYPVQAQQQQNQQQHQQTSPSSAGPPTLQSNRKSILGNAGGGPSGNDESKKYERPKVTPAASTVTGITIFSQPKNDATRPSSILLDSSKPTSSSKGSASMRDSSTIHDRVANLDEEVEDGVVIGTPEQGSYANEIEHRDESMLNLAGEEADEEMEEELEEEGEVEAMMKNLEEQEAEEAANAAQAASVAGGKVRKPFGKQSGVTAVNVSEVCSRLLAENQARAKDISTQIFSQLKEAVSAVGPVQIRRRVEDYPFYQENLVSHAKFRPILAGYVFDRKLELQDKQADLREEYAECFATYKKRVEKYEKKKRASQGPPLAFANSVFGTSLGSIGSDIGASSSLGTRSSRRGNSAFTSDAVKSEAEWEQVLAAIAATEQTEANDSKVLAQTIADPPMILCPLERRIFNFQNFNRLVIDPAAQLEASN